ILRIPGRLWQLHPVAEIVQSSHRRAGLSSDLVEIGDNGLERFLVGQGEAVQVGLLIRVTDIADNGLDPALFHDGRVFDQPPDAERTYRWFGAGLILGKPIRRILQAVALLDKIGNERLALGAHRRWITRHSSSPSKP